MDTNLSANPQEAETPEALIEALMERELERDAPTVEGEDVQADTPQVENEPEAEAEEPSYTVKINGEEKVVPISELTKSYMMEADYRRKTSEVAEQRRALEAERQAALSQVEKEKQNYLQNLQLISSAVSQDLNKFQNVDWNKLVEEDPVQYLKLRQEYENKQASFNAARAEQERIFNEQQSQLKSQVQELIKEGEAILSKEIPNWNNDTKLKLFEYGVNQGFDKDEVSNIIDPRLVKILHKSYLYDQLQKAKPEVSKKVEKLPPKVERPGTGNVNDQKANAIQRLRSSGKVEDAAAAIAQLL